MCASRNRPSFCGRSVLLTLCYLGETNDIDDNVGAELGTDLNVFVVVVGGQEGLLEESHFVRVCVVMPRRKKRRGRTCPVEGWVAAVQECISSKGVVVSEQ